MIYRFDDCVLDADRRELRRGGALVPVEPQVFDILEFLIRNRERVVGRQDMLDAIWSGRIVSDATLDTRLSAARRAIGDSGAAQRSIRTLRNKGLRFIGAVHEDKAASGVPAAPSEISSGVALTDHPTIAVLPLANIGGDPALEPLADGVTEDLIVALGKVAWLRVMSRASSFACKGHALASAEAARRFGVRYLLQGAVRRAGGRRRITVHLVDAIADQQIWAERHDLDKEPKAKGFRVQDAICEHAVAAIEPRLYLAELIRAQRLPPANLNCWECMVRALALINSREQNNVAAAQALLQKAVSIEPYSAPAHSLLSMATTLRVHMSWADRCEVVPAALAHARTALSSNLDEPWAHAALGYALIWKQPEQAIMACQRAVALDPDFAVGHYFLALACAYAGQYDEVFVHAAAAERLASRDLLARGYAGAHDNVRATGSFAVENYRDGAAFGRSAALCSPCSPTAYRALIMNLALSGQTGEARQALRTLKRLAPTMSQDWIKRNAVWSGAGTMKRYMEAFRIAGLK